jgi:hypothetical protein
MWTSTRYGWFSTTCTKKADGCIDTDTIMIRARLRDHLDRLRKRFPVELKDAPILETRHADYRFRCIVPKSIFVAIMGELASEIMWSNHKSEVARFQGPAGQEYASALHAVWAILERLQPRNRPDEEAPRRNRR